MLIVVPEDSVDVAHDTFCPRDGIRNEGNRSRTGLGFGQVFGVLDMAGNEDARCNQKHALAALVHPGMVASSPFVRLPELRRGWP